MSIREFFIGRNAENQRDLAHELLDTSIRWSIVGCAAIIAGAVAENFGVKEGVGVSLAGFPVEYVGFTLLTAAGVVDFLTHDGNDD